MIPKPKITGKPFLDVHPSVKFGKRVTLRNFIYIGKGSIIGDQVKIANYCNIDSGTRIGDRTNFQVGVQTTMDNEIGSDCFFGAMVCLADEKFPATGVQIRKPVKVGNNVIIGTRTTIVAVDIGRNSVIAAHSAVYKDVPPNQVWGGVPAKPIMIDDGLGSKRIMERSDYDRRKAMWEDDINGLG